MLSLNSVCINTDKIQLVKDLSVSLLPSAIVYLKGKNGCGKTSLIRTIAGIKQPNSGNITIGKNNTPIEYLPKPYCTYIGHHTAIKSELTLYENLHFWAKSYRAPELIAAAIAYFKLEELASTKCHELSAGQKQKTALCRLICCPSSLWLLDEPESNLDSEAKQLLDNLIITKANSGGIIIASSHCQQVIKSAIIANLLEDGMIVFKSEPAPASG